MSRLDELPPDQSAALSLLLRQRKSYAEVAALLGIGERAVHDRAQGALVMLAPTSARALSPEQRLQVGDYLLGQQASVAERLRTRSFLAATEPARAWASELAAQLAPLTSTPLPEIPPPAAASAGGVGGAPGARAGEPQRVGDLTAQVSPATSVGGARSAAAEAFGAGGAGSSPPGPQLRSSRAAGAVLLAVLAAAVIVAVVLITGGGSHTKTPSTSTSASTTTTAKSKGPKVDDEITLKAVNPADKIIAVVYVLSEGTKRAYFIAAQNLPETKGFYYAIWLYDSPHKYQGLSRSPPVGSNHSLAGGSSLPANAGEFHEILLTEETKAKPAGPGRIIMRGPFRV